MTRSAPIDPPQIHDQLWEDFRGALAFDVGSNVGQSLPDLLGRFSQVIAFEPAEESFQHLHRAWRECPQVVLVHAAVSREDGEVKMAVVSDQIATGQLVSPGTHGVEQADWDNGAVASRTVPCWSLDTLLETYGPPDFIKVDTEGHELEVLAGGLDLIARFHPAFLIEFHNRQLQSECQRLLESRGYAVEMVRHPHYAEFSDQWYAHGWLRATYI